MPTARTRQVLKKLPQNNFNVAKTMRNVGYAPSTCRSGQQYKIIRNYTQEYFPLTPSQIEEEFEKAKNITLRAKDYSNYLRSLEGLARIKSMFKDYVKTEKVSDAEQASFNKIIASMSKRYNAKVKNADEHSDEKIRNNSPDAAKSGTGGGE